MNTEKKNFDLFTAFTKLVCSQVIMIKKKNISTVKMKKMNKWIWNTWKIFLIFKLNSVLSCIPWVYNFINFLWTHDPKQFVNSFLFKVFLEHLHLVDFSWLKVFEPDLSARIFIWISDFIYHLIKYLKWKYLHILWKYI